VQLGLGKAPDDLEIHPSMIGTRLVRAAVLVGGLVVLVFLLGPGAPRPEVAAEARRMISMASEHADDALAALAASLAPALEAGRAGSARVVAGDEPPGPKLAEAAALTVSATDAGASARDAMAALDRARDAADPDAEPLAPVLDEGELESIAVQLDAAADAADEFAAMRMRAGAVTDGLEAVLAALEDGDLGAARARLADVRASHAVLAAWDVGLVTLPVWIGTADAMIDAVEGIVTATEAGDPEAAEQAATDFAALAEDGATADRALRIAIGEGGTAVAAAPLQQLASIMSSIQTARAVVSSVQHEAGP
jgi:hypothetical protein